MDDATENLDMTPVTALSDENPENLQPAQNLNLDAETDFNLDEVLDNPGAAGFETPLNLAEEEESKADLDMESWLSGISQDDDAPADINPDFSGIGVSGAEGVPEFEDAGGFADSLNSDGAALENAEDAAAPEPVRDDGFMSDIPADQVEDGGTESLNFSISETDADELNSTEDLTADNAPAEETSPAAGNGWAAEETPESETEAAPADGGGWLAETETSVGLEAEPAESAVVADENPTDETETSVITGFETENEAAAENSWLTTGDTAETNIEESLSAYPQLYEAAEENAEAAAPVSVESEDEAGGIAEDSAWLGSSEEEHSDINGADYMADNEAANDGVSAPGALATAAASGLSDEETKPGGLFAAEPNFVKWFSGSVHDEMFEISKNELPAAIDGSAENNIIHVNAGYDTYGWLVEFDGGPVMSLDDVRKYQIRNGALPADSGVIRYGANQCRFSNIERILIYQSVRYFSYGA
ncbi:MAG: hypothetical protein KHX55_03285 [Proteobacteria bacterium]|nr:hypothetical protein [Pseudomonadota bacterium]